MAIYTPVIYNWCIETMKQYIETIETMQNQWERRMLAPISIINVSIETEHRLSGKIFAQNPQRGNSQRRSYRKNFSKFWEPHRM